MRDIAIATRQAVIDVFVAFWRALRYGLAEYCRAIGPEAFKAIGWGMAIYTVLCVAYLALTLH